MRGLVANSWAASLLLSACATSSELELEVSRLRRELAVVQRDLSETKVELERVQSRVTLISLKHGPVAPPVTPVAQERKSKQPERVLPVVRVAADAKRAAEPSEDGWDQGAPDDGSPPILIQLGPSPGDDKLSVDHEVLKQPNPLSAPKEGEREAYDAALTLLRDKKQPQGALTAFELFRARYPGSRLSANVVYWTAECYVALGQLGDAVARFDEVVAQFPRSAKVADALLRSAETLLNDGKEDAARQRLERVLTEHADSDAAPRARERLAAIAAKGGRQ